MLAETLAQAQDAAALVEVDYEELPAAIDIQNGPSRTRRASGTASPQPGHQLLAQARRRRRRLRQRRTSLSRKTSSRQRVFPLPMETRGAAAAARPAQRRADRLVLDPGPALERGATWPTARPAGER